MVKVFHAARQDIEIIWNLAKLIPAPLFDTQVAAMVCGYGDQVSYGELAQSICKVALDKSSRFTDWSRRPLVDAQIAYAIADVTYLRDIYRALLRGKLENPAAPPGSPRRWRCSPRRRPMSSIPKMPGSGCATARASRAISPC